MYPKRYQHPRRHRLSLVALLIAMIDLAHALPDDRQQPIRITADSALRDDQQGVTRYRGNVELLQGSLAIRADEITVSHDREQTSLIVAQGSPALMSQLPAVDEARVEATAERIEYRRSEDRVRLMTNARIAQDGATISGDIIDYLVTEQRVLASVGDQDSGRRVEVVIPPSTFEEP